MSRLDLILLIGISVPVLIILTLTDVYAFVEDYLRAPTNNGIQMILVYCFGHPNGNITTDLVEKGIISTFYTGYDCNKTAQEHPDQLEPAAEAFDMLVNIQKGIQGH